MRGMGGSPRSAPASSLGGVCDAPCFFGTLAFGDTPMEIVRLFSDGGSGPEVIIYDFGECVKVDGFALWAVGDGRHDPHSMTLAVGNTPTTPELWCVL